MKNRVMGGRPVAGGDRIHQPPRSDCLPCGAPIMGANLRELICLIFIKRRRCRKGGKVKALLFLLLCISDVASANEAHDRLSRLSYSERNAIFTSILVMSRTIP